MDFHNHETLAILIRLHSLFAILIQIVLGVSCNDSKNGLQMMKKRQREKFSGALFIFKNGQLRESPSPKRVVGQLGGSKSTPMCIYEF